MFFGKRHHVLVSLQEVKTVTLPTPKYESNFSVEEALESRRSIRAYKSEPLTLQHLSQLLWAAQGITYANTYRTAPSAGALYPLEIYLVAGDVVDLSPGVYKYHPDGHKMTLQVEGDKRKAVAKAALFQNWMSKAPVMVVITAVYRRTSKKYGKRGDRYVHIEVGHVAQNIYLQAGALNLGTVIVGAYSDQIVKNILNLQEEQPLAIMPIGVKE